MKYVLLFAAEGEDVRRYEAMTDAERADQYRRVGAWYGANRPKIVGGNQLSAPETATTVRWDGAGESILSDGPFLESNEVIGGYVEIEVADLDEALEMARTWPPRGTVEVRPILEMRE